MNWFEGSVSEAIKEAKLINGIFIVYVYDKSEISKSTTEKLESEEIGLVLQNLKYIAIKIENGSTEAIQFAQIYPLIVMPSIFFINSENGIPLEIVGGGSESNNLSEKLKQVFKSQLELKKEQTEAGAENANTSVDVPSHSGSNQNKRESDNKVSQDVCQDDNKNSPNVAIPCNTSQEVVIESNASNSLEVNEGAESGEPDASSVGGENDASKNHSSTPPLDERVARAKEILQQKQEEKVVKEIEEEKEKEKERRRQSKDVVRAKQKREEQQLYEQSMQRKKDKEEERLARERVKAQIAADRAEREARNSILRGEQPPQPEKQGSSILTGASTPSVNQNRNVTRIKFRFPDNSSELAQFSPDTTLQEVRTHLIEKVNVPFSKFKLIGTLPPKTFTEEEMTMTLFELGLTPSAIIIVKPVKAPLSPASLVPSEDGTLLSFIWLLFAPFTFILNYFRNFLGGRRNPDPSLDASEDEGRRAAKIPRTEDSFVPKSRPKSTNDKNSDKGSFLRREGNIHRLNRGGEDDDDKDNNTWNGNSTQQM